MTIYNVYEVKVLMINIVLKDVTQNSLALEYAWFNLKNDKEFILKASKKTD